MMLTLTLNGKIIELRFVRREHIRIEGYLEGLQKDMEEKYGEIIDLSRQVPEFYLEPGPAVKKHLCLNSLLFLVSLLPDALA
jgi:hypothetical protein